MTRIPAIAAVAVAASLLGPVAARAQTATQETAITSAKLEYDFRDAVVVFDGNVRVVDPQFTLTADRVLVYLEGTNDVRQVRAMGNVNVVSGDRTAACQQADYTRADGRIVMTGDAVLQRPTERLQGSQITIWVQDERLECIAPRMTFRAAALKGSRILP